MLGYIVGSTLFPSGPGYPCHRLLFEQSHYPHLRRNGTADTPYWFQVLPEPASVIENKGGTDTSCNQVSNRVKGSWI